MKWVQWGACAAALTMASSAWSAQPEAVLGKPVPKPSAGATKGGKLPAGVEVPGLSGLALGRALGRLQPEGASTTRGAGETRVYAKAAPAVVLIISNDGVGSGALISADGKIVTNLHVVGAHEEVGVVFKPAIEGAAPVAADVRKAKVIRRDDVTDLALVQVEAVPAGVTPLVVGNSTTVQVGADVHAIGHPTGEAWTYTRGVVSQIRRAYQWRAEDKVTHEATVIQTQTPINPGNSGGPLLDDSLAIIGINSFKSEGEGLNFAVSAEDVKSFLARSEDRLTQKAATPTKTKANIKDPAAEGCEPAVLYTELNADRTATDLYFDANCDDEADALMTQPADKREPTLFSFDDDGDGKFDTTYVDDKQDGNWDLALYDVDGDGEPDMKGYFKRRASKPYRWEKIDKK